MKQYMPLPGWGGVGVGVKCSLPWTGLGVRVGGSGVIRLICYSIYNFEETIQIILLKEYIKK